jgi:hypothetical protein
MPTDTNIVNKVDYNAAPVYENPSQDESLKNWTEKGVFATDSEIKENKKTLDFITLVILLTFLTFIGFVILSNN